MRRLLAGTAALAALIACSHGRDDGATTNDANEIIHGKVDDATHDSVVLLVAPVPGTQDVELCTGTVVAPNLVLTARHCVSETDGSSICNADGTATSGGRVLADKKASTLRIYTGVAASHDRGTLPTAPRVGVADSMARGKKIIVEDTETYCDHDVAFLLLDRNLDVDVAPMRLESGPREGELVTAVGWGYTENGKLPSQRMVRPSIPVRIVGPRLLNISGAGLGDSEFQVGEAFCQGDSGGPAFATSGAVMGVVSRGGNGTSSASNLAAGCIGTRTANTYTHLSEKLDLVRSAFVAAGHMPVLEVPVGDAGAEDASVADDAGADAAPFEVPVVRDPADASATLVAPQPLATSSNAGGCSAAPGTRGTASSAGLVGLALLLVRRRRRRG